MQHVPDVEPDLRQPPPDVRNGLGRAGLLLGACGLAFFWVPMVYPAVGILAITLSAIGYSNARAGTATNGKSAMLGLVLGILSVVLPAVALLGVAMYVQLGTS